MKIETLKDRIEKKTAQIEKKQNTIAKKIAQIEKKTNKLASLGYGITDTEEARAKEDYDAFWMMCDIDTLKDDIERGKDEIEECKATLAKYEAQLAGEIEKENTFIKEVPEIMKDLERKMIEEWDAQDQKTREFYRKKYNEMEYREFVKKYSFQAYEMMYKTDADLHTANEKDARYFILDLLNRVKAVTGEVTNWKGINLEMGNMFPVLNGIVEGKEGRAIVESILAGGYNIQRLHVRTLVKAF